MKKLTSLMLVLATSMFAFGCGDDGADDANEDNYEETAPDVSGTDSEP